MLFHLYVQVFLFSVPDDFSLNCPIPLTIFVCIMCGIRLCAFHWICFVLCYIFKNLSCEQTPNLSGRMANGPFLPSPHNFNLINHFSSIVCVYEVSATNWCRCWPNLTAARRSGRPPLSCVLFAASVPGILSISQVCGVDASIRHRALEPISDKMDIFPINQINTAKFHEIVYVHLPFAKSAIYPSSSHGRRALCD